ncbi:MAG: coproporphyrinogen-III oxidase family protein [Cetobacterium sp.]|uniref:coproporphyrinogen-III oxidase family protein n=1 Tax=Cetobacterium sp. TaxID=2071632 RepID=UPI003EE4F457
MFKTRFKSHHDVKDVILSKSKRKLKLPTSYWKLMNKEPEDLDGGIYVHVPFCDKICSFCNMNRKQLDNDLEDYTKFLIKEINKYRDKVYIQKKKFSVIFFGGGTPTILKPHQLEKVLSTLREVFPLDETYEFTFETTLHNLTWEKLEIMKKYGVNRLSIGIQTFSNRGRKLLNRTYEQEFVMNRVKEIKEKFGGLVCLDIIYNYLDQSLEEVVEDARIVGEVAPDSVSFYSLMIHDGSSISKDLSSGEKSFDYKTERDRELHDAFLNNLLSNGYEVLEHTKLTRGTDSYRYIRNVHKLKDLIPIGVGAGGRVQNMELYHLNKLVTFYSADSEQVMKMKRISGLTQYEHVALEDLKIVAGDRYSKLYEALQNLEKEGYIELKENEYKYTQKGIFWGNNISSLLVEVYFEG